MTDIKKTRRTKKTTVKAAEVKKAEVTPEPTTTPTPEPSNRNSTRAVADIPAREGFLGAYGSKNRKDPGVDDGR